MKTDNETPFLNASALTPNTTTVRQYAAQNVDTYAQDLRRTLHGCDVHE